MWFGGAVKVDQMVEITDEQRARAWLETQDHQTRVWFASRCALRVLPLVSLADEPANRGLAFTALRATIVSSVNSGGLGIAEELFSSIADAAYHAAQVACSHGAEFAIPSAATLSAGMSARSVAFSKYSAANSASAVAAYFAAADAVKPVAVLAAEADTSKKLFWGPLWQTAIQPIVLQNSWVSLKNQWAADDCDWSFWVEWYEAILNGTPMPWELTHRIALEVKEGEWEAGQSVVAERIKEIRREWNKTRGRETQQPMPGPSLAQKQTAAARVASNRDAIALTVVSLLEQLCAYREHVRGLNRLDSEYRDDLLAFIDALSNKLHELVMMLPEKNEAIEPKHGGAFIHWLQECRALVPGVAKRYVAPENVVEAALPTSIILGCTGVGALIGGPVGAGAGGVVGQLISNQMKPGQAAKVLLENRPDAPESQQ